MLLFAQTAQQEGGVQQLDYIFTLILTIIANVTTHYINKWLDRKNK